MAERQCAVLAPGLMQGEICTHQASVGAVRFRLALEGAAQLGCEWLLWDAAPRRKQTLGGWACHLPLATCTYTLTRPATCTHVFTAAFSPPTTSTSMLQEAYLVMLATYLHTCFCCMMNCPAPQVDACRPRWAATSQGRHLPAGVRA